MIEASHLRIGNLIEINDGHIVRVIGITPDGRGYVDVVMLGAELGTIVGLIEINGIPLTEEWLLKFGFEQGGYDFLEFWIGDFNLMGGDIEPGDGAFAWNYYLYRTPEFGGYLHKQIEIKYVHQLQNLYFALTGEELKAENPSRE